MGGFFSIITNDDFESIGIIGIDDEMLYDMLDDGIAGDGIAGDGIAGDGIAEAMGIFGSIDVEGGSESWDDTEERCNVQSNQFMVIL